MHVKPTSKTSAGDDDLVQSAWNQIRAVLEAKRHRNYEEIRNYPRPIPACDQQFNYLLEERAWIAAEIEQMETSCEESLRLGSMELVKQFIASSRCLDGVLR